MPSECVGELLDWQLLGSGACGTVQAARNESGDWYAVKTLDSMAINRRLLERMTARAEEKCVEAGFAPVVRADWSARPPVLISPLYAEVVKGDGDVNDITPRSLQRLLADHMQSESSWPVVRKLADSLAAMHRQRLAHGNLKPGNIFFDHNERLLLTDWAQGMMPEVPNMGYSDALLYASPEQLRDPAGYLEEKGYRWDVYSFGTIAYRLLTGAFPRCDETFLKASPSPGEDRKEGIDADLEKIARNLELSPLRPWGDVSLDAQRRRVLERCLALDPLERYADLEEVVSVFDEIDYLENAAEERASFEAEVQVDMMALRDEVAIARTARKKARSLLGLVSLVAVGLGCGWGATELWRRQQGVSFKREIEALVVERDAAKISELAARKGETAAVTELEATRITWNSQIRSSREIGDTLFRWVIERGSTALPTLEGRKERVARLVTYFQSFIKTHGGLADWQEEVNRARLQLAELSLAMGDEQQAEQELSKAMESAGDAIDSVRFFRARALLGLLSHKKGDNGRALEFLEPIIEQEPLQTREVYQLRVAAGVALARIYAVSGDYEKSRNTYSAVMSDLEALGQIMPELLMPKAKLARMQLEEAFVADGQGEFSNALSLRKKAAEGLAELVTAHPSYTPGRVELAGVHRALAETALVSGDHDTTAREIALANQQLSAITGKTNAAGLVEVAAVLGTHAILLRDRGDRMGAGDKISRAITQVETILSVHPQHAEASYRKAQLLMIKSSMLGDTGDQAAELEYGAECYKLLQSVEEKAPWPPMRKRAVKREMAIAAGNLGHAALRMGEKETAQSWLLKAIDCWEKLSKENPKNEEYSEGALWGRSELEKLN